MLARFIDAERRFSARVTALPGGNFAYEFIRFGLKQGWACLFGGIMLALLIGTRYAYPATLPLARYDALFIGALAVQIALLATRIETFDEAKVILLYHVTGTVMELFKTSVGSWIYPEPSLLRIGGVPLFTGFMYSCIGSYIFRVWRLFEFRFTHHPPLWTLVLLSLAIYVNFFAHHYVADMRLGLFGITILLFGRTRIHYRVWRNYRTMPLLLGFVLVALFIWLSENIGTYTRTWLYPSQLHGWSLVSLGKLGSWFLLLIISYTMVAVFNRPEPLREDAQHSTTAQPQPESA